jgi:hypothetical protein
MTQPRDFIYLDIERVRSFVAQASGGVPTERTGAGQHEGGGQVSAGGGLPFVAKIEGQADYRYVRSSTETRSVQDAIFEEFVTLFHPLEISSNTPWPDEHAAPDGQLVLVNGYIKLIDYDSSLEALRAFPKLMTAYSKFSRAGSSKPGAGPAAITAGGVLKAQADALGPMVEGIAKMVGSNLSDFVRVKVVRNIERPAEAIVGDGHRDSFRYSSAILTTLYPGGLAAGWHCVGMVHRPTDAPLPAPGAAETMADMLEGLLDQMHGLEAFRQAAQPPAIAITPLAIYRLLVHQ